MRGAGLAAILFLSSIVPVHGQDALGVRGVLDDPGGLVSAQLAAALARAERGGPSARLTFFGASHTASDQFTSVIRDALRRRVGDGGSGLVMPAAPFSLYGMRDFVVPIRGPFVGRFIRGSHRTPGRYGRAGMVLDIQRAGTTTLRAHPATRVAHVELWLDGQPGGGSVELEVAGHSVTTSSDVTASTDGAGSMRASLDVPVGRHDITVRALGDGPVRIFGVLSESDTAGVVVEAFGVPGARARDPLVWDRASLTEQLALRAPDLIAIGYGTNESGDGTPLSQVAADVDETLRRLRAAAPGAACLVIGPGDRPRLREGHWTPRARSDAMNALYHRGALAHGCAYFDLLAFVGGAGGIASWVAADLALSDHVHLTDPGYARMGNAILRELGALRASVPRIRSGER
jgi:lysophospholipase L1-like esterase